MSRMRRDIFMALLGCVLTVALVTAVRWFGPGDLYEKDQPKTIAYTADIVLHGRFALPRDVIYQPATKPPFYNWIGAAAVWISGSWNEWVLKFPTVLGVALTAGCVAAAARRTMRDQDAATRTIVAALAVAVFFTFGSDVRHGSVIRLSYLARPDMLQCGLLTAAWLCAWIAFDRTTRRTALPPAIVFWLLISAAILTKGPAALMAVLFAVVYPFVQTVPRRDNAPALLTRLPNSTTPPLRTLSRLHWELGIPLVLLLVGVWFYFAYRQDPQHVREVILGAEVGTRLSEESPEGFSKPVYFAVMWFVTKALPWGGLALIALYQITRPAFRATAVYLLIILVCLSLPAGKRMDYILPAYAPAAVLVGGMLMDVARRLHVPAWTPIVLPLAVGIFLTHRVLTKFHESITHDTDRAVAFGRAVRQQVAADQRLLVLVRGKHPLPTLLGLHQGSYLTADDLRGGAHVIMPEQPDLPALLLSEPLPIGFDNIENRPRQRLGVYYFPRGDRPIDRLVELQRQIGTWEVTENPYRAPGTVYRDD